MSYRYEKVRSLGSGAFGKAWLSKSKTTQKQCVIKEIDVCDLPQSVIQETLTEAQLICNTKHENLLVYTEAFVEDDTFMVISDYADGGNLNDRIREQGLTPFPESLILNWLIQMSMALSYLHDQKLVHGDLKPENVLFTYDQVLKLGDYVFPRKLRNNIKQNTVYHLSPEFRQTNICTYRSDVWALGCIVYQLCCHHLPFHAQDDSEIIGEMTTTNLDPIPRHYGLLLQDLVMVMLRIKPDTCPNVEQILSVPDLQPYIKNYKHGGGSCKRKRMLSSLDQDSNNGNDLESKKRLVDEIMIGEEKASEMAFELDEKRLARGECFHSLDKVVAVAKVEDDGDNGCQTPERIGEKSSPVCNTPEDHGSVECFSVESPKKLRMLVTPLMKDRALKHRAAYSCEKGMKLNVGNPQGKSAPVLNLSRPFTTCVRRMLKRGPSIKVASKAKLPPPVFSPGDLINDSGIADHDLSSVSMASMSTPDSDMGSSTPFRVPHNRPRLSVPVLDMREEHVINIKNIRILYLAMLESDTCAMRARSTLTFYLQKTLGTAMFDNLYEFFKEAMNTQMDFDLVKGRMNKNIMYLPLFAEILRLENQTTEMQD